MNTEPNRRTEAEQPKHSGELPPPAYKGFEEYIEASPQMIERLVESRDPEVIRTSLLCAFLAGKIWHEDNGAPDQSDLLEKALRNSELRALGEYLEDLEEWERMERRCRVDKNEKDLAYWGDVISSARTRIREIIATLK